MVPVVELRGAIPYAAVFSIDVWLAAAVAVVGNMIPVPVVIWGMDKLIQIFGKTKGIGPALTRFVSRAEKKARSAENIGMLGLMVFVGIPLPGTGAWTGAMIASIVKLPPKKAMIAIFGGLVMSASIMCIISYWLPDLFKTLFLH